MTSSSPIGAEPTGRTRSRGRLDAAWVVGRRISRSGGSLAGGADVAPDRFGEKAERAQIVPRA